LIYPRENPTPLNGGKMQHHLYFDTMADFPNLPKLDRVAAGSDAFCVETGDACILRGDTGEWELI